MAIYITTNDTSAVPEGRKSERNHHQPIEAVRNQSLSITTIIRRGKIR
jgi:hypothetical protein